MAKSSRSLSILLAALLMAPCVPARRGAKARAAREGGGESRRRLRGLRPPQTAQNEGELPLAAKGAIVIDALTGETLYEKNADAPQFPASTTKIMTALLVIEEGDLDQEVEVTLEDSKVGRAASNLKPGQRFTRTADALRPDAEERQRRGARARARQCAAPSRRLLRK